MYSKMHPYYITKELREKGWKYTDDGVYIPWPFQEEKYYLVIYQEKYNLKYRYAKKGHTQLNGGLTRSTGIENDLKGNGQTISYDDFIEKYSQISESLYDSFETRMYPLRENVTEKEFWTFFKNLVADIKETGGLDILLDPKPPLEFNNFKNRQNKLIEYLSKRKNINLTQKMLAEWLKDRFDIILRKNSHNLYILDEDNNCYTEVTKDELLVKISNILGPQLVNDNDLAVALSYISDRLDPKHNIIKFKNCLYDITNFKIINNSNPVFTLVETTYRYNPEAKSEKLKNFLYSSLAKESSEKTEETVQGIKEVTGYLFTSGNRLNLLPMITGISGGGKSVFANILTAIFGKDKIADLKLQEIEKNTHATSSLVNKHLNIIQDSDSSAINNNSLIKQLTGNDPLQVNPKYVDPYVIPKEEVPKSILICNRIPFFKQLEPALLERFLIIEFNVKFRGTENENPNLLNEILANPEEVEWFIYESIEAYREMQEHEKDFILRKDGDVTRKLVDKHQNPVSYILNQLIKNYDSDESKVTDKVYTQDLNTTIQKVAKIEGLDLDLDRKSQIPPTQLIKTIRFEFNLDDMYITKTSNGKRYYPGLIANDFYFNIINKDYSDAEIKEMLIGQTKSKEASEEAE